MSFEGNTTLKRIFVGNITRPAGGGSSTPLALPRTGVLARLYVNIAGAIAGVVAGPNALGMAAVVNRCRVTAQGGQDLINVSGEGYHYLYRRCIDSGRDPIADQTAYNVVAVAPFDVSMIFPIQVNMRDHAGLFNLQNEQTLVTVNLDWRLDTALSAAGVVSATTQVFADIFTLPDNPKDRPDMSFIHQVLEDQNTIAGAGQVPYEWPRGSIYLRQLHGLGIAQAGADGWTSYQVKRNESDVIVDDQSPLIASKAYGLIHQGLSRFPGTFQWSGVDYSGLGSYGLARDTIDSSRLTNIKTFVAASGAGTLYSVRDTLLDLKHAAA